MDVMEKKLFHLTSATLNLVTVFKVVVPDSIHPMKKENTSRR